MCVFVNSTGLGARERRGRDSERGREGGEREREVEREGGETVRGGERGEKEKGRERERGEREREGERGGREKGRERGRGGGRGRMEVNTADVISSLP